MLKKIDWGMVLPLALFVIVVAAALAVVVPEFITKELYVGAFLQRPVDWQDFLLALIIGYLTFTMSFVIVQVVKEIREA